MISGRPMNEEHIERFQWRTTPHAVELGFEFYLGIIERRLNGEDVSMVQSLRDYFRQELRIDLRETQARGLMHRDSSVFPNYARAVSGQNFVPGIQHWEDVGLDGFQDWRKGFFRARDMVAVDYYVEDDDEIRDRMRSMTEGRDAPPTRQTREESRIIRDSALSRFLKILYDFQCQICMLTFRLPTGALYAESHHVRPLGGGHAGLDIESNMLVLCPNHHAMMDYGVIAVHPVSLTIVAIDDRVLEGGKTLEVAKHPVGSEFLEYHLANVFNKVR